MGEVDNLRNLLARADLSAPSIQGAAAQMMKMYDRSSTLAVNEWRNQLQSCSTSQYIPLLYVANEVIQTSKRNRGTKFLEAFGPILAPALQFICGRDPSLADKVRRTVKIWADRQVFSVRYTTDLLHRLNTSKKPSEPHSSSLTKGENSQETLKEDVTSPSDTHFDNQDEDDTESSPFRTSGPSLLKVDNLVIDKDMVLKATEKSKSAAVATFGMKRRRSQEASKLATSRLTGSNPNNSKKHKSEDGVRSQDTHDFLVSSHKNSIMPPILTRRRSVLSTPNILELLSHMAHLDREFSHIQNTMTSFVQMKLLPQDGDESVAEADIVEVGDELIQLNQQCQTAIQAIQRDKHALFSIAEQKKVADGEVQKYLPFYKNSLKMDEQDSRLCEVLEERLKLVQWIHGELVMITNVFVLVPSLQYIFLFIQYFLMPFRGCKKRTRF